MRRIVVVSTGGWDSVSTQYRLGPLARAWRAPFEVQSARWLPERAQVKRIFDSSGSDAVLILQRVLPERNVLRALRSSFGALVFDFDHLIELANRRRNCLDSLIVDGSDLCLP